MQPIIYFERLFMFPANADLDTDRRTRQFYNKLRKLENILHRQKLAMVQQQLVVNNMIFLEVKLLDKVLCS
jgi:dephospho-CoA kinase